MQASTYSKLVGDKNRLGQLLFWNFHFIVILLADFFQVLYFTLLHMYVIHVVVEIKKKFLSN